MAVAKTFKERMVGIFLGVMVLEMALWFGMPYILVALNKNIDFTRIIERKINNLYKEVSPLATQNFYREYIKTWRKQYTSFLSKQKEKNKVKKQKRNYKELPLLTYTQREKEKIQTSRLTGMVSYYRKLKLFYLLFYAPLTVGCFFIALFSGSIKRLEKANEMQVCSENIQKLAYVSLLFWILTVYIIYGGCPELIGKFPYLPHSVGIFLLNGWLGVSVYYLVSNIPYTQAPAPGK